MLYPVELGVLWVSENWMVEHPFSAGGILAGFGSLARVFGSFRVRFCGLGSLGRGFVAIVRVAKGTVWTAGKRGFDGSFGPQAASACSNCMID